MFDILGVEIQKALSVAISKYNPAQFTLLGSQLNLNADYISTLTGSQTVSASYILQSSNINLPNARVAITGSGITILDGGAGGNFTFGLNVQAGPNIVLATGSAGQVVISGTVNANQVADVSASYILALNTSSLPASRRLLSGNGLALTDTGGGGFFTLGANLIAGPNITLTTQSVGGAIAISGSVNSAIVPDISATFLLVNSTASLPNERNVVTGSGIKFSDAGAGSTFKIGAYLAGGANITLATGSDGQITINAPTAGSGGADPFPSYLLVSTTASLTNERTITAGKGIAFSDAGAQSTFTIGGNLIAGPNITITTQSVGGALAISASTATLTSGTVGFGNASNQLSGNANFLYDDNKNQIRLTGSQGAVFIGIPGSSYAGFVPSFGIGLGYGGALNALSKANQWFTLANLADTSYDIGQGIVAGTNILSIGDSRTSGTLIVGGTSAVNPGEILVSTTQIILSSALNVLSGALMATNGMSGSHTALVDGTAAFKAGPNIAITLQSNGAVAISGTINSGITPDISASYVLIGTTSSLPNERTLTAGKGIAFADAGAGSTITTGLNIVAGPNITITTQSVGGAIAVSAALGDALLTSGTIGYGNSSNILTGSGNLVYNDNINQLSLTGSTVDSGSLLLGIVSSAPAFTQKYGLGLPYSVGALQSLNSFGNNWLNLFNVATVNSIANTAQIGDSNVKQIIETATNAKFVLTGSGNILSASGGTIVSGTLLALNTISGSHQALANGTAAFIGGPNINIQMLNGGAVAISGTVNTSIIPDVSASYLLATATGSLPDSRNIITGSGMAFVDGGNGSTFTFGLNIVAGPNITISTQSVGGAIAISASSGGGGGTGIFTTADPYAKTTSSLAIGSDFLYANQHGTDVFFYVSGAIGSAGVANSTGASVFGGDVFFSGSTIYDNGATIVHAKTYNANFVALNTQTTYYISASTSVTVSLPTNPQVGQRYEIIDVSGSLGAAAPVLITASGSAFINLVTSSTGYVFNRSFGGLTAICTSSGSSVFWTIPQ